MYRRNLPHIQKDDFPHFVSFRTYKEFGLVEKARDLVLQHCLFDRDKMIHLHAVVIMPNHVHLLFTPLRDENGNSYSLAKIMNRIKGTSSYSINKMLGRQGPVWQDESFDRVIRSTEDFDNKLNYIIMNPMSAGLARDIDDYPWLWRE